MSGLIRLALADDQALVRMGLKALLGSFDNLQVVIEAENGEQLLQALPDNPVDVILSDIRMPGMDGFALLKNIRERNISTPVILLTTFDEPDFHLQAAACGA
ncbi:MAG: response regulator transcription factor, partial [Arenimonas sp.]